MKPEEFFLSVYSLNAEFKFPIFFCGSDPDSYSEYRSGSTKALKTDPIWIWIDITVSEECVVSGAEPGGQVQADSRWGHGSSQPDRGSQGRRTLIIILRIVFILDPAKNFNRS